MCVCVCVCVYTCIYINRCRPPHPTGIALVAAALAAHATAGMRLHRYI